MYVQKISDKEFLQALGNRLREFRVQANITQEELGFRVGNSGKQIGRIERGENNVTTSMIYKIALALKVELKEIFDFKVPKKRRQF